MKDIMLKRFFFFIGFTMFFYLFVFFPTEDEEVVLVNILLDILKSILVGFVTIYVTNWMGEAYPRQKVKG